MTIVTNVGGTFITTDLRIATRIAALDASVRVERHVVVVVVVVVVDGMGADCRGWWWWFGHALDSSQ